MRFSLFITVGVLLVVWTAHADRPMSPEERKDRVEAVIIGKFATELELSPQDAEKFYPRLRQFRLETEDMQRELTQTRARLDAISAQSDGTSKDDLKSLLSRSKELQTGILTKREALLTDLAEFLTPQQVSRCALLLDDIPRRIRQFMDEQGRGGPPADRPRGGRPRQAR